MCRDCTRIYRQSSDLLNFYPQSADFVKIRRSDYPQHFPALVIVTSSFHLSEKDLTNQGADLNEEHRLQSVLRSHPQLICTFDSFLDSRQRKKTSLPRRCCNRSRRSWTGFPWPIRFASRRQGIRSISTLSPRVRRQNLHRLRRRPFAGNSRSLLATDRLRISGGATAGPATKVAENVPFYLRREAGLRYTLGAPQDLADTALHWGLPPSPSGLLFAQFGPDVCVDPRLHACVAILRRPTDPAKKKQAFMESGDRYLAKGQLQEASIEYRNAVQVDARFGEARVKLAETYAKLGDHGSALSEYVRAADPARERGPSADRGQLSSAGGKAEDARSRAESVLKRDPKNVQALILLGNALAGLKNFEAAVSEIEEAIQLEPHRSASYDARCGRARAWSPE